MPHFALVRQSSLVTARDAWWIARALRDQALDIADAWLIEPMDVVVYDDHKKLPKNVHVYPMVIVDDKDAWGTLASHMADPYYGAAARVFAASCTGTFEGDNSVCEAASHEYVEALIDPFCNGWVHGPERYDTEAGNFLGDIYAKEVADPSQRHYEHKVGGLFGSTTARLANFVYPAWFNMANRKIEGVQYDHMGELTAPFQIGAQGYCLVRDGVGSINEVWGDGPAPARASRITDDQSRGARRKRGWT